MTLTDNYFDVHKILKLELYDVPPHYFLGFYKNCKKKNIYSIISEKKSVIALEIDICFR